MIQFKKRRINLKKLKEPHNEVDSGKHIQYVLKKEICYQADAKKHMYNQIFFHITLNDIYLK